MCAREPKTNKKMPNKEEQEPVVSKIEGDEEEDSPYQFQDNVLSCLADLQHIAAAMKEKAKIMDDIIRDFRISIHKEDIDA